jgi:sec-independent protein translocase protein TatA
MFGLGGQELLLILFVVLLFFGPSKLPELARGLGKGMREFKKAQADLEHEFNSAVESVAAKDEKEAAAKFLKNSTVSAGAKEASVSQNAVKTEL